MPNPKDVPPVSATRNRPVDGFGGQCARLSPWSEWEADYYMRLIAEAWADMTPRQRRKLARADVGIYAVVKAIAETRKGL